MYSCKYRLKWQNLMQILLVILVLSLTACAGIGGTYASGGAPPTPTIAVTPTPAISPTSVRTDADICPSQLKNVATCQTPHSMRVAYNMESLIQKGFTGKGQTVVDIVSFGSPTLSRIWMSLASSLACLQSPSRSSIRLAPFHIIPRTRIWVVGL